MRWTVACGSLRMPASYSESINGLRLKTTSSFRSKRAMVGALPLSAPVGNHQVFVSMWGRLGNPLIAVSAHDIISS